jgi:uncharacterized protein (DUF1697 family)
LTAFVALVRAVNVSGTGKLPKEELKAMGEACGFGDVRTFINSGNLLFTSSLTEAAVQRRLEERLALGPRVIYIAYGDGMANSKLKASAISKGTARNMNSVQKMADLLAAMA